MPLAAPGEPLGAEPARTLPLWAGYDGFRPDFIV